MKAIRLVVAVLTIALLLMLNVRVHSPGDAGTLEAQLHYLEGVLGHGAADEAQADVPEGYVFTWTLYGLASARMARQLDPKDSRRPHFLAEARRALASVRSPKARATFNPDMHPPLGAFYNSWSLYLHAEYVRAVGAAHMSASELADFTTGCDRFAQALAEYGSPFMESYPGRAWPADTPPGVAALAIHDAVIEARYSQVVQSWVRDARARLDTTLHALSHSAESGTGRPIGGVRGASLALMSRILVDVDPHFAREQYTILRERFLDDVLGVPGVREYPPGTDGKGDVDSGPIVFGFSGPAIVVGAAAARAHGDKQVADALLGSVELVGFPIEFGGERFYAGGMYPVGDAFIAWARSSSADAPQPYAWNNVATMWFVPFHAISAIACALLAWWGLRVKRSPGFSLITAHKTSDRS